MNNNTAQKKESKKDVAIYLLLTLGVCFLFGILAFILPTKNTKANFIIIEILQENDLW